MAKEDEVDIAVENDVLVITVKGVRDNFSQVINGSERIAMAAKSTNKSNILADYSGVQFNLNLSDAFNLIRLYENQLTDFKNFNLAVVVNDASSEIAKFYESIGKKRAFNICVFTELAKAKSWFKSNTTPVC